MTDTSSAVLARAAEILESLAAKATPGPWANSGDVYGSLDIYSMHEDHRGEQVAPSGFTDWPVVKLADARWISLMSPAVAAPLAAWLRDALDDEGEPDPYALEFAQAIVASVDGEVE